MSIPQRQLFIGGKWVAPAKGGSLPVVCPATEQVVGSIPAATAEDVDAAVSAAASAAQSGHWTQTTGAYRAGFLRAIAQKAGLRASRVQLPSWRTPACTQRE